MVFFFFFSTEQKHSTYKEAESRRFTSTRDVKNVPELILYFFPNFLVKPKLDLIFYHSLIGSPMKILHIRFP